VWKHHSPNPFFPPPPSKIRPSPRFGLCLCFPKFSHVPAPRLSLLFWTCGWISPHMLGQGNKSSLCRTLKLCLFVVVEERPFLLYTTILHRSMSVRGPLLFYHGNGSPGLVYAWLSWAFFFPFFRPCSPPVPGNPLLRSLQFLPSTKFSARPCFPPVIFPSGVSL